MSDTFDIILQTPAPIEVKITDQGLPVKITAQGLPGKDGISAYDVAVINGFVGTEQEWLASLIGDYNLPIATDAILGGVKVGDNLTIDEYGKLNAQNETGLIKKTAMDLGGHRVVSCNSNGELIYADNLNDETINSVIGLTTSSSLSGSSTKILDYGEITFSGWSWVMNSPIFLASNGLLTQTIPDNGWMIIMGFPTGVNSLFINIQETIKI